MFKFSKNENSRFTISVATPRVSPTTPRPPPFDKLRAGWAGGLNPRYRKARGWFLFLLKLRYNTCMHHQGNTRLLILVGVFSLLTVGLIWGSLSLVPQKVTNNSHVNRACTAEAKICPDGSAVVRTGPNCEFAVCPKAVTNTNSRTSNGCIITGCSGQICDDHEVITTCEARPEYACYISARCERQLNGICGWTMTAELVQCLRRY